MPVLWAYASAAGRQRARVESHGIDGISLDLYTPEGTTHIRLRVPGVRNVYNAIADTSVARGSGYRQTRSRRGSAAPGRIRRFRHIAVDGKTLHRAPHREPGRRRSRDAETLLQERWAIRSRLALNDG